MSLRLFQYATVTGQRAVAAILDDAPPCRVPGVISVRELALEAHRQGLGLEAHVRALSPVETVDYAEIERQGRLRIPLDHAEPSRMTLGITGLTHLGSAATRDEMHRKMTESETLSDTMKMFRMGLDGGKPTEGDIGVQPEWAYKGDGLWCVAPGEDIQAPGFAMGEGEEAEVVGLYVIGDAGEVLRIGYCLGNEYSDHLMEQQNYLYLAHSKLRQSSFGPEILVGELPAEVRGTVRVIRDGDTAWEGEFLSGEDNMSHSLANLEHHHFKYRGFRRPGDVHVYYYGASILSSATGIYAQDGDVIEIDCPLFGHPLRNRVRRGQPPQPLRVVAL
ncbi:AraD1 family protein [Thalassorhabdomicrobium marinisediminis]|uniref:AraD1 family protein n=1 Tax=Thalassorhabdomicrobium marinisediminis TaxID=2170577 RepID=UPI002490E094|nr:AraD1 family protein [Thalassorhabdomicrobium marinisediminis]